MSRPSSISVPAERLVATIRGVAMKYLCLVYHDETKFGDLSQAELDAIVRDGLAWVEELRRDGRHVFSAALQSVRAAASLRQRNNALSVTDGPFAETKEFLAGFTVVDARDLNEAIQIASKLPAARFGTVEVRPVLEVDTVSTDALDRKIAGILRRYNSTAMHPLAAAKRRGTDVDSA